MSDLTSPRYTQSHVLKVTGLQPAVLQTWINRGAIKLVEQNPGYGRARLYSAFDIVKLAVMRRCAELRINLSQGKEFAETAADELERNGSIDWNDFVIVRCGEPAWAGEESPWHMISAGFSKLALFGSRIIDPKLVTVETLIAPWRENEKSDETRERDGAAKGFHAEPVIIFPLGEVVNGALLQLQKIDDELAERQKTEKRAAS